MGIMATLLDPLKPLVLIAMDLALLPVVITELVLTLQLGTLFSPSRFRAYWFARLWAIFGRVSYAGGKATVMPLVAQAKGRVLDIGTGTGHFLRHYDLSQVTKVFSIEINEGQHPQLLKSAHDCGLRSGRFELLDQPLELLRGHGDLKHGSIDTVVTLQVLCSVDDPGRLTRELYEYLKPGGRWIAFEHVVSPTNGPVRWYQGALELVWPHMFAGCHLCRDTKKTIEAAGKWASMTWQPAEGESSTAPIPHVGGILYKA